MRVCLLALEFFNWGKYGGIGKITREIADGLVERGIEVSVVIPQGENQSTFEIINGIKVFGYPIWKISPKKSLLKKINADVYHSQDPIMATITALKSMPSKKHVVTFQNPKSKEDWLKVIRYYRPRRILYNTFFEPKVKRKINKCDRFFCQAKFTLDKVNKLYSIGSEPYYLPNPVDFPDKDPIKSDETRVFYLGRLDGEKNPERFIKLAKNFPDIKFILAGEAHDARRRAELNKIEKPRNLEQMGFVDGLLKNELLEKSWILVNTSLSECLPVAFLEALANGCAILSNHDPDKLTSRFGYHVKLEDFEKGLDCLLKREKWRYLGKRGREYISRIHEKNRIIDLHLKHYRELLEN